MTKNEFIKRYGEEAYKRKLEYYKQYHQQHKEEIKQYREQHKEEMKQYQKQYQKQYFQQHKEKRREYKKQYREQHREEIKEQQKQYSRQYRYMFAFCIPEEWEQIENYELAKKDNFDGWHIHHRLETHNSDGQRRLVNISKAELIALDMYYNRPASELVFLTRPEHTKLHRTKQHCSKE